MTPKAAARILLRTRQCLLVAAFVLSAVWTWRRQGLFRIFADLEIRWTGGSDAAFTMLYTFLTLFVASMALSSVFTSVIRRRVPKEDWPAVLRDTTALWDSAWRRKE